MTKYSNEFKVKAIKMVLKGDSISHVAKILNMPNTASLCRWIFHYENSGIPQLLHKNRKYTPIFKQKVIEYKWLHHLSLNQTATKFSIPNTGTISTWENLYRSYGFSAPAYCCTFSGTTKPVKRFSRRAVPTFSFSFCIPCHT